MSPLHKKIPRKPWANLKAHDNTNNTFSTNKIHIQGTISRKTTMMYLKYTWAMTVMRTIFTANKDDCKINSLISDKINVSWLGAFSPFLESFIYAFPFFPIWPCVFFQVCLGLSIFVNHLLFSLLNPQSTMAEAMSWLSKSFKARTQNHYYWKMSYRQVSPYLLWWFLIRLFLWLLCDRLGDYLLQITIFILFQWIYFLGFLE